MQVRTSPLMKFYLDCYNIDRTLRGLSLLKNPCFMKAQNRKSVFYSFGPIYHKANEEPNPCIAL